MLITGLIPSVVVHGGYDVSQIREIVALEVIIGNLLSTFLLRQEEASWELDQLQQESQELELRLLVKVAHFP